MRRRRQRHLDKPCGERCALLYAMTYADPAWTLQEIGGELGTTRERARQLIAQHGWRKPSIAPSGSLCSVCGQRYLTQGPDDDRAHRATHPPRTWPTNYERMAVIVAAYEAGWLMKEIIEEVGIKHVPDAYHYMELAGYKPTRGYGWGPRDGNHRRVIQSVETQQIEEVQL